MLSSWCLLGSILKSCFLFDQKELSCQTIWECIFHPVKVCSGSLFLVTMGVNLGPDPSHLLPSHYQTLSTRVIRCHPHPHPCPDLNLISSKSWIDSFWTFGDLTGQLDLNWAQSVRQPPPPAGNISKWMEPDITLPKFLLRIHLAFELITGINEGHNWLYKLYR